LQAVGVDLVDKEREARAKLLGPHRIRMNGALADYCIAFRAAVIEIGSNQLGAKILCDLFLNGLTHELLTRMGVDRNGEEWATWEVAEKAAVAAQRFLDSTAHPHTKRAAPMQAIGVHAPALARTAAEQLGAQADEAVAMSESRRQGQGGAAQVGAAAAKTMVPGVASSGHVFPVIEGARCDLCDAAGRPLGGHLSRSCPFKGRGDQRRGEGQRGRDRRGSERGGYRDRSRDRSRDRRDRGGDRRDRGGRGGAQRDSRSDGKRWSKGGSGGGNFGVNKR
jgi:hypothetical protein